MDKPSPLHMALGLLYGVFHQYSDKEGDPDNLSKGELKELLQQQMGPCFGDVSDKGALDDFIKILDTNQDDQMNFEEYITMVGAFAVLFQTVLKQTPIE